MAGNLPNEALSTDYRSPRRLGEETHEPGNGVSTELVPISQETEPMERAGANGNGVAIPDETVVVTDYPAFDPSRNQLEIPGSTRKQSIARGSITLGKFLRAKTKIETNGKTEPVKEEANYGVRDPLVNGTASGELTKIEPHIPVTTEKTRTAFSHQTESEKFSANTTNEQAMPATETIDIPLPPPTPQMVADGIRMVKEAEEVENKRKRDEKRAIKAERDRLDHEYEKQMDKLDIAVKDELTAVSVFYPGDMDMDIAAGFAAAISFRAEGYTKEDDKLSLGNVKDLHLFETRERAEGAGKTLLTSLLAGKVEGASEAITGRLRERLYPTTQQTAPMAQFKDGLYPYGRLGQGSANFEPITHDIVPRMAKKQRLSVFGSAPDPISLMSNETAWELIQNTMVGIAREASARAHTHFFQNISVLKSDDEKNGTVAFAHPDYPELPPGVHDFNESSRALKFGPGKSYIKNEKECGIYTPLKPVPGEKDPMDNIIDAAGGHKSVSLMGVEGFGEDAFVALYTTSDIRNVTAESAGGYMSLVCEPHVPGSKKSNSRQEEATVLFNFRNLPEVPEKPKEGVHDFVVKTWHLTDAGYTLSSDLLKKGKRQRPFVDPRPRLRKGQEALETEMDRTRQKMDTVLDVREGFNAGSDELLQDISSGSVNDEAYERRLKALSKPALKKIGAHAVSGELAMPSNADNHKPYTLDSFS